VKKRGTLAQRLPRELRVKRPCRLDDCSTKDIESVLGYLIDEVLSCTEYNINPSDMPVFVSLCFGLDRVLRFRDTRRKATVLVDTKQKDPITFVSRVTPRATPAKGGKSQ
jgi:hypothetical protein